jgi:acetolactate synthase regulatory subunit
MFTLRVQNLISALEHLPPTDPTVPPGSISTFYKVEIKANQLICSGNGRNGSYCSHTQNLDREFDNIEFLVPAVDTMSLLKSLDKNYYIHLLKELDNVRVETKCSPEDSQVLDSNLIPTFAGDITEFKTYDLVRTSGIVVKSNQFSEAAAQALAFGDYTNKTMGERAALLQITAKTIEIYALALNSPNYYYRQTIELQDVNLELPHSEVQIPILGNDLELLAQPKCEFESLCLTIEPASVTSFTDSRQALVRVQDLNRYAAFKAISQAFAKIEEANLLIRLVLPSKRAIEALTAQQPKASPNKYVRLEFKESELKISKSADLLIREFSLIPYFQAFEIKELNFNTSAAALLKSIRVLDRALAKSKVSAPICFEVYELEGRYVAKFNAEGIDDVILCSLNLEPNV